MDGRRAVTILPPEVSRRIAAGEVIERPASVVRELIDNSIDAGADEIDISWEAGGTELIRVHDNGFGLTEDDLRLCWKPHATSKITSLEDLERTTTLGFRGEALSSIAAVSSLSIATSRAGSDHGYRLIVDQAKEKDLQPAPPIPGTTVEVRRLFANLPARRRFLSRPQAETAVIRNVVLDKALPFPGVRFTYQSENSSPVVFSPEDRVSRVAAVFGRVAPAGTLQEVQGSGDRFRVTVVAAHPEIVRRDRRYIRVFVNNRRVWEYNLIQAVEYAYQDLQHGGLYPVAALFVDIEPDLVDFNIHPAKREVRIRPSGEVHHRVVEVLRSYLRAYTVRTVQLDREFSESSFLNDHRQDQQSLLSDRHGERGGTGGHQGNRYIGGHGETRAPGQQRTPDVAHTTRWAVADRPSFAHNVRAVPEDQSDLQRARNAAESPDLMFRGTVFDTYIIVEWQDRAYLIDQHAAHERLLYNHYREHRGSQTLLVPEEFDVTEDQDVRISTYQEEYRNIGIELERAGTCRWRITALPPEFRDDAETIVETIVELGGLQERLDRIFLAELACKAAVKGGDFVDDLTALELARRTLRLDTPRCPHGRPLWVELTRRNLDVLIGRI